MAEPRPPTHRFGLLTRLAIAVGMHDSQRRRRGLPPPTGRCTRARRIRRDARVAWLRPTSTTNLEDICLTHSLMSTTRTCHRQDARPPAPARCRSARGVGAGLFPPTIWTAHGDCRATFHSPSPRRRRGARPPAPTRSLRGGSAARGASCGAAWSANGASTRARQTAVGRCVCGVYSQTVMSAPWLTGQDTST